MRYFRKDSPKRTCTKTYANYKSFKKYLREDFNFRCGYTDCSDFWFGGSNTFHIDHFKPYSKYPTLKTTYSNLVYCCSYVNILKSNDEGNYLHPYDVDFNEHFDRNIEGRITPKATSVEANYMYNKLKLGLKRYALIWKLDELVDKQKRLIEKIETLEDGDLKDSLHILNSKLSIYINKYLLGLKGEQ
ncbi:HNH endonuclease family protein [Chryseobacterium culicis]|uniref:TIGR02646 family protein n=1 Tax=Chryseobacterium culicis TaxID=680127 RepID=A0A1H6GW67_CHRCI|nr:hypothetical protein [Chryseobacterium culicis]SEH27476.1 TIGR02646 family protein [Chryseobacterium culicis]